MVLAEHRRATLAWLSRPCLQRYHSPIGKARYRYRMRFCLDRPTLPLFQDGYPRITSSLPRMSMTLSMQASRKNVQGMSGSHLLIVLAGAAYASPNAVPSPLTSPIPSLWTREDSTHPERQMFCVREAVPQTALELGSFTKPHPSLHSCGRFGCYPISRCCNQRKWRFTAHIFHSTPLDFYCRFYNEFQVA